MCHADVRQLRRSTWLIYARNPGVAPPVCEQSWVVEAEHVDVRPVDEVVRADPRISAGMVWTDDADARWVVLFECVDECFRPAGRLHLRIVVDAIEVLHVVEVRLQHGIVLRPCGISRVIAADEADRRSQSARAHRGDETTECRSKRVGESASREDGVVVVVGEVEMVAKARRRRPTERLQEDGMDEELVCHVRRVDAGHAARRKSTADGDASLVTDGTSTETTAVGVAVDYDPYRRCRATRK